MIEHNFVKQKSPFYSIALILALLIAGGAVASMSKGSFFGSFTQLAPNALSLSGPIPDAPYVRFTEILGTLNLNSSEKAKVSAMLLAMRKKNSSLTDISQRRANAKITDAAITAILSPDQRSDLQAKLEARPPNKVTLP
jgi:hypothetical protein